MGDFEFQNEQEGSSPDEQVQSQQIRVRLSDPLGFPPELREPMVASREKLELWAEELGLTEQQAKGLWDKFCQSEMDSFNDFQIKQAEAQRQAEAEARDAKIEKAVSSGDGYHLTPEEASAWLDKMRSDPNHPYMNDRATPQERQKAVAFANRLMEIMAGKETSIEGWHAEHAKESRRYVSSFGETMDASEDRSASSGERPWNSSQGGLPEDNRANTIL